MSSSAGWPRSGHRCEACTRRADGTVLVAHGPGDPLLRPFRRPQRQPRPGDAGRHHSPRSVHRDLPCPLSGAQQTAGGNILTRPPGTAPRPGGTTGRAAPSWRAPPTRRGSRPSPRRSFAMLTRTVTQSRLCWSSPRWTTRASTACSPRPLPLATGPHPHRLAPGRRRRYLHRRLVPTRRRPCQTSEDPPSALRRTAELTGPGGPCESCRQAKTRVDMRRAHQRLRRRPRSR